MGKLMLIVFLFATIVNAKVDVRKLFNGQVVPLGPFDTYLSVGNLTEKYPHLHHTDVVATKNGIILIELLRKMFNVGIYPLPVLEPYRSENLDPIDIDHGLMTGTIKLNSVSITGLKGFNLKELEIRMDVGRVDFRFAFPVVDMKLHFQTDLRLSKLIPVILSGVLNVHFDRPAVSGAFGVTATQLEGFGSKRVYQLVGATVHANASNVEVSFSRMQLANDLLQSLDSVSDDVDMARWMESLRDRMDIHFLNGAVKQLNTILKGLTTEQVKAYLIG